MNTLNDVPYGHIESDMDEELKAQGITDEEISKCYELWVDVRWDYPKMEKAIIELCESKGIEVGGFVPGESDSFGPLTRGLKITRKDGTKVCAYYG